MKKELLARTLFALVCVAILGVGRTQALGNAHGNSTSAIAGSLRLAFPDSEQSARGKHGWNITIKNSLIRGTIIFFDSQGRETNRSSFALYRDYPDRLRVEVDALAAGFDHGDSWRAGIPQVSNSEARAIRNWFRYWPERLFLSRAGGAPGHDAGRLQELPGPGRNGREGVPSGPPSFSDAYEVIDTIQLESPGQGKPSADERRLYYLINATASTIDAVKWLEPDDPNADASIIGTKKIEVRVDFSDYRAVDGVLWPYLVTHSWGGKKDFQVQVVEVKMNQQMPDTLFKQPK